MSGEAERSTEVPGEPGGTERSLVLIGYWRSDNDVTWPLVADFIDERWDPRERRDVVTYLRHGTVARSFWGTSTCRVCGVENGSAELTDGTFIWPEGLVHYVEHHGVRPPDRFVAHVSAHRAKPLSVIVDDRWWRQLRAGPTTDH